MAGWKHDSEARRKYFTEVGVNGWNEYTILVHPADLTKPDVAAHNEKYPFHIYAICQHPRILLDPGSFHADAESVSGVFRILNGTDEELVEFDMPNRWQGVEGQAFASATASDDGAEWACRGLEGEPLLWGRTPMLLRLAKPFHYANDLEVLYVGKSFGAAGERTAPDRLAAHATLQAILADMVGRRDVEPTLMMCHYQYQAMMSMDGLTGVYGTTRDEDRAHVRQIFDELLEVEPGPELTSYTEAALIRHFAPPYNRQMMVSFPDSRHASYAKLYDLDLLHLSVVLETEQAPLHCTTWSQSRERKGIHMALFDLHDTAVRAGCLEFPARPDDELALGV